MRRWAAAVGVLLAVTGTAYADEPSTPDWVPDDGERTAETRTPPSFTGMEYGFPIRLHLARGGFVDGSLGGVNAASGELLLILPRHRFRIELTLVDAVTPLRPPPAAGTPEAAVPAPEMLLEEHHEFRLLPTWRSGLGLGLSFVLPGAGQWIQRERPELGFLFLGGAAFFVGTGLLALYAPSQYGQTGRRIVGGIMFGLAGTVAVGAGVHAWEAGKERVEVRVKGARVRRP